MVFQITPYLIDMCMCDGLYWHSVRKRSFECAYRIMLENGIKPTGGELLITVE